MGGFPIFFFAIKKSSLKLKWLEASAVGFPFK